MAQIYVANAPVSWGIMEDRDPSDWPPYDKVMREIAEAGYTGTELGPYGYYPIDPDTLRSKLQANKLTLTAAFVPLHLSDPLQHDSDVEQAMQVARLLAALNAPYINFAGATTPERIALTGRVPTDGSAGLGDEGWQYAAALLTEMAKKVRDLGLASVFHHHAATYVETPQELAELCARTDPDLLGICLDTGHYVIGGGVPREAVKQFGDRIRYLHLKDVNPGVLAQVRRENQDWYTAVQLGVFAPLGSGSADVAGVIQDLKARDFNGWAVVEQDMFGERDAQGHTPLEAAKISRSFLREQCGI